MDSMKAMMQNPMIAAMIPGAEAMKAQNVQIGHKRMGYDWMMENNETDWINAFFGSKEEAEAIPSLEEGYPTLFSILHNSSFYNSFPERPLKGFLRGSLFFRKNDLHSSVECGWAPWGGRVRTKQKQGAPLNRTHPAKIHTQ